MSEEDGGCQSLARKQGLCQFHYREKQEYNEQIGSEKLLRDYVGGMTRVDIWEKQMLPILEEMLSAQLIEEVRIRFLCC